MTRAYNVIDADARILEALPYRNADVSKFYPYGDVRSPE